MLFFFNIKIISDWIDLGHPATWVMDFNGFKTLLFCKLFLFNFMINQMLLNRVPTLKKTFI